MSSKQIGDNEAQLMPIYLTSDIAIAHFFLKQKTKLKHFYLLCLYVDRSHRTGSTSRTLFELPRWNYSFTFRSGTWNSQNFLTLQLPFWMLTKKKHSFQTLRSLALLGTHSKTLHNTRRGCLNFFCVPRRNWNKKLPRPIRRKTIFFT